MQLNEVVREGPLSLCQELLLYNELSSRSPPMITRFVRVEGPLDVSDFVRSADAVIAAHEPLRTSWVWRQYEPVAQVKFSNRVASSVVVNSDAKVDWLATIGEAITPSAFNAATPPHLRHWIFRKGENDHLWFFCAHHIAADAISLKLYAETFSASYARRPQTLLATTSIEYAFAQKVWLESEAAQAELIWWLQKLEPILESGLPVRRPTVSSGDWVESQELRLPIGLRNAVLRVARREGCPPAAIFLAAYAQTVNQRHARASHCVLINVPGRNLRGATASSGACYNSVPLVLAVSDSTSAMISSAANEIFDALDRQGVPAPLISLGCVRQGGAALRSRVPVTFNVIDHPLRDFKLAGCRLWEVDLTSMNVPSGGGSGPTVRRKNEIPSAASMDWIVSLLLNSIVLTVEYTSSHADRDDVSAFLSEYEDTLYRLCDEPIRDRTPGCLGLVADWTE